MEPLAVYVCDAMSRWTSNKRLSTNPISLGSVNGTISNLNYSDLLP
jgi:hypothetical protein